MAQWIFISNENLWPICIFDLAEEVQIFWNNIRAQLLHKREKHKNDMSYAL